MIRILHLEPGPISDDVLAELRRTSVFLANTDESTESRLRSADVEFEFANGIVSDGSTLIIPRRPMDELAHVVDRLLGPGGCPWDQEQTHESLKKHLLEEVYEVFDAIDRNDLDDLREELGDLLLQPIMHAQMQKRDGSFDIDAVAVGITDKLVRRHPHVFGDISVANADEVLRNWDAIKRTEKSDAPRSVLAGIPSATPALVRAYAISKRAARVGFEWEKFEDVFAKLDEEVAEVHEAIQSGDADAIESEIGDVLFTVVNIARWAKVDAEEALRKMLNRFSARFTRMEELAVRPLGELSPLEWDQLWTRAKSETQ